jgi:RNA polymerase sigma-70 factor (ECF subfamily)
MTKIDNTIITRCQAGDKDAFRSLVETCQGMVFSVALKMLADEEEAKDIVQETFLRVWQGIGRYDPQKPFATWLYTIATRLCLDRLKAAKLLCPLPDDERVLQRFASDADSHRTLENTEWMAIVRLLAEGLSEKQRLVFTLCQLEGLTSEEAEQITGLDARQVKSNLYVARQTIRKRLITLGYE